jgi:hypothetical protein
MENCTNTERFLTYCKDALEEIKGEQPTGGAWERRWGSLMALFRTTCEILRGEAPNYWRLRMETPNAAKRGGRGGDVKNEWEPSIFGKFIWTDANLFLHQGKLTAGQSRIVYLQGVSAQALAAGEQPKPVEAPAPVPAPETSYHMNTEPYKARDPLEVAAEAIVWLEKQIEEARRLTK